MIKQDPRAATRSATPEERQVVVASRKSTVSLSLVPATALMTAATMLLIGRLILPDWQGLLTETLGGTRAERPALAAGPATAPAKDGLPAAPAAAEAAATKELQEVSVAATKEAELPGIPQAEAPEAVQAEAPMVALQDPVVEAAPPADAETAAVVDDIAREAERKKAEKAELEKLRKEAEARADASPPRRGFAGQPLDQAKRERWLNERRAIERQMLEEMMRQQREFEHRASAMLRSMRAAGAPAPPQPWLPPAEPGRGGAAAAGEVWPPPIPSFPWGLGPGRMEIQSFRGQAGQGFTQRFRPALPGARR